MIHVGIDPGINGAIAIISKTEELITVEAIHDMPVITKTTSTGKTRNRIDVTTLHRILSCYPVIHGFTVEDVHSRPGEGATNAFTFGHGLGCVETVARLTGAPVSMVSPRVWKGAFGLTADKGESRYLAQTLTGCTEAFKRVKDADKAEAYLMALYGACNGLVEHQGTMLTAFRSSKPKKGRTGDEILADLKARVANL